jgi:valyl-tRNA synthetase
MSTVLDQVRTLCTKLQLGNNARVSTLVLNAGDEQSRSSATTMAARLRAAARAEQIVFGAAEHEGGVPGIAIDIVA